MKRKELVELKKLEKEKEKLEEEVKKLKKSTWWQSTWWLSPYTCGLFATFSLKWSIFLMGWDFHPLKRIVLFLLAGTLVGGVRNESMGDDFWSGAWQGAIGGFLGFF